MYQIRKAEYADFDRIMTIYRDAQEFMIREGNPTQWGHFYPDEDIVRGDIEVGRSLLIVDEAGIHGVFALFGGEEPTYAYIENGKWLNDEPYVTIHRIATDGQSHGIVRCASDYCKSISSNVRIDTHADNTIMQRQIEKSGFTKCGTIYVEDGSARIAYQWTEEPEMITAKTVNVNGKEVEAVCITAPGGEGHPNMLVMTAAKGYIMCGYLNLEAAEKFGDAACVISGSSFEELLANPVKAVTSEAAKLGIEIGMTGAEVCDILHV